MLRQNRYLTKKLNVKLFGVQGFHNRLAHCLEREGGHFEYLLKYFIIPYLFLLPD
jgi:hypothetical protein